MDEKPIKLFWELNPYDRWVTPEAIPILSSACNWYEDWNFKRERGQYMKVLTKIISWYRDTTNQIQVEVKDSDKIRSTDKEYITERLNKIQDIISELQQYTKENS